MEYRYTLSDGTAYMIGTNEPVKCGKYLAIQVPDHPKCWKNGYLYQHRVVAELYIVDRLLRDDEIVHHRDHDGHNNKLDNLEILTLSEHATLHGHERPRAMELLVCAECEVSFTRECRQSGSLKGYRNSFCSRSCSGSHSRRAQLSRARIPSVS